MKKFFRSLLAKYMLIILMAIFLVQFAFIIIGTFFIGIESKFVSEDVPTATEIEEKWHKEANNLQSFSKAEISQHFAQWKKQYPDASMFWVDERGDLVETVDLKEELPQQWTAAFMAKFIKARYGGEPFTVIAFLGKDETNGFIVLELPRKEFQPLFSRHPMTTHYSFSWAWLSLFCYFCSCPLCSFIIFENGC